MDVNDRRPASATHALGLLDEAMSYLYPAALGAVAQLGVADHLANGALSPDELAALTGAHALFLHRTLRLLATRGIFGEDGDGKFHLTLRAEALRSDAPLSVRAAVIGLTSKVAWRSAEEFIGALRDGKPAFDRVFGVPFFEHVAKDPQAGVLFYQGMASFSDAVDGFVAHAYDLPESGTVVDVGGGFGGLLLRILRLRRGLLGVLFDREQALAAHRLGELGEPDRWEVVGGDFFEEVPAGGDIYVLKYILHDWSDEECVRILRNCRDALGDGRVLVVDSVIEPGNEPDTGKLLDVMMMLNLTGRERTAAEFDQLLGEAGLRLVRIIPTGAPVSIIEAVPAD